MIRLAVSLAMMTVLTACTPPSARQPQTAADADSGPWIQQAAFDTATGDARIEAGLAAAQGWLQKQEIQRAAQVLEALAETPGTADQQARYALLMGEIRLAQQRPEETRRWLERAAGSLPPPLESRRLEALARLSQAQASVQDAPPPANPATSFTPGPSAGTIIALLLPTAGRFERVGQAIQDGFLQAYLEQVPEQRPTLKFFPIGDQPASAITAANQALAAGAHSLIGPLDKPAVEAVVQAVPANLPMLALNRADVTRAGLVQFGLPPEDEARTVAQRALASGRRQAWVIIPRNEWGERLLMAFDSAFIARGGRIRHITRYAPTESDFQAPLKQGWAGASGADMLFLAAFAPQARLLCPQIRFVGAGNLPIYATSAIDAGTHDGAADLDLDTVRFPEMPWLLSANQGAQMAVDPAFARMQAFGFDAYHIWQQLAANPALQELHLAGATGMLSMTPDGRIERHDLPWAYFANGRVIPGLPADEPASMAAP
jgi:outer membrane PBP1 activator LpoA protein